VVADVLDRKVTVSAARERYGVVMDALGQVDHEATAARRRAMAATAVLEVVDRGTPGLGLELARPLPRAAD
jgi:hypothetical protein